MQADPRSIWWQFAVVLLAPEAVKHGEEQYFELTLGLLGLESLGLAYVKCLTQLARP